MDIEIITKGSFSVIGKEGSTEQGSGFVQQLWADANSHYDEVASLAKKGPEGIPVGFWGAMTDFSRVFMPWEDNFSKGLYLAGVECDDNALPPPGWTKWTLPSFRFIRVRGDGGEPFAQGLSYLNENGFRLAGAVQDYTDPKTGLAYMCFPISRL